ncbi:MAG: acetyl-CoA hydrolase, partial [Halioglobus sp.]|nr:acetyl-CoA hydrolase [Halioglobus sp.]
DMTRISFVNTLFGNEDRKRRQRRHARFINETMMATLLGAAVSDALEDGRVVSGVGGQFDFVSMAHSLQDAYSILMLPATRVKNGTLASNIRWSYGHSTVPRHHRDIYITQYGIAATRGKTDAQTIDAMLQITDSAFQAGLIDAAWKARKLAAGYRLPPEAANNHVQIINDIFSRPQFRASFPEYPLGTDLTATEQRLSVALEWLQRSSGNASGKLRLALGALMHGNASAHDAAMTRLGLDRVSGLGERMQRRLVGFALQKTGQGI